MATLTVPAGYGLCIVSNVFGTFAMGTFLGSKVMKARDEYDVQYPNLYATPGFHKQADAFNRVQRGHQSMFESVAPTILASLVGGLRYVVETIQQSNLVFRVYFGIPRPLTLTTMSTCDLRFLFFLAATRTCAPHLRPFTTLVATSIRLAMPIRNRMSRWRDT